MKRPTKEQQQSIIRVITREPGKLSPEDQMVDSIKDVQQACISNKVFHMTKSFTNIPGQLGVVQCYMACSDEVASELHEAIDKLVKQVFAEHGLAAENNLPI